MSNLPNYQNFTIGFDPRDKKQVFLYWDEIFTSQKWTEGKFTSRFEERWEKWNELPAVAVSSWAGGAMAAMEYFQLKGKNVLCPTNTFMATPLSLVHAGAHVIFADCNRNDLCLSYDSLVAAAKKTKLSAVWVVHIGGHIAFEIDKIAAFCRENNIILLEDCAHAHGADWNGRKPGSWGDCGIYSFYATKTVSTGEGGMLVSRHAGLIDYAKKFRNYGKTDYAVKGLNYRMSEFTAALGLVQAERMEEIIAWKIQIAHQELDPRYPKRIQFPTGMRSGYYKYIVFEPIEKSTGKVYDQLCHSIMKTGESFPNAEWVAQNHWCVPLYYNPAAKGTL